MKLAPASCSLRMPTISASVNRDFRMVGSFRPLAGKPTASRGPNYRGNVARCIDGYTAHMRSLPQGTIYGRLLGEQFTGLYDCDHDNGFAGLHPSQIQHLFDLSVTGTK